MGFRDVFAVSILYANLYIEPELCVHRIIVILYYIADYTSGSTYTVSSMYLKVSVQYLMALYLAYSYVVCAYVLSIEPE